MCSTCEFQSGSGRWARLIHLSSQTASHLESTELNRRGHGAVLMQAATFTQPFEISTLVTKLSDSEVAVYLSGACCTYVEHPRVGHAGLPDAN